MARQFKLGICIWVGIFEEMKNLLIILLLGGFVFSSNGCKRCRTCKYTYTYAGISETVVMEEVCGSTSEVNAYRDQADSEAAAVNGKVTCVDN